MIAQLSSSQKDSHTPDGLPCSHVRSALGRVFGHGAGLLLQERSNCVSYLLAEVRQEERAGYKRHVSGHKLGKVVLEPVFMKTQVVNHVPI